MPKVRYLAIGCISKDVIPEGECKEHYHGLEDIPDEHRVFSMPKVPIREQMAAYQEMANRASLSMERPAPKVDRRSGSPLDTVSRGRR